MRGDPVLKKMVSRKEAAAMYSMAPGTLANWLSQRCGPRAFKVRGRVLYRLEDLEVFFCAHPILTTDSVEVA
ncbi:MAG: DNA-binding protein [Deltaproteobacteria bacterium]|nr:DNA-binding protein [Deltaproteobacteria bacterium]